MMLLVAWEWVGSCCQHDIMSADLDAGGDSSTL